MLNKTAIIGSIASFGVLLGTASGEAIAQTPHETHPTQTEQTRQFRRIEQPLENKVAVTLVGLGLISLELWWFLFSKPKSKKATTSGGIQEVTVTVDGGYEPSRIVVQAGQPVRLNFQRQDPSSCLEQVLIPDFHIAAYLPLNQVTSVEFTPEKAGDYVFTCGMNMFRGEIRAEVPETGSETQRKVMTEVKTSTPIHQNQMTTNTQPLLQTLDQEIQKVTIIVDKGYTPNHVVVKAGQPVQISFLRENKSGCLAKVLIPDFDIAADLPLNEVKTIEFTPEEVGEHAFTCGMKMVRGVIEVQAANTSYADQMAAQASNN